MTQRLMQRLFTQLRDAGQSEIDARTNAEYTARIYLSKHFRDHHPRTDASRPLRLSDLFEERQFARRTPVSLGLNEPRELW